MLRIHADLDYFTDLLPALLVFSLGLALTVAPLTATVLADADESNAGIASGVNNAIARVAGCWPSPPSAPSSPRSSTRRSTRASPGSRLARPGGGSRAPDETLARLDPARSAPTSPTRWSPRRPRRSTSASASRRRSWRSAVSSGLAGIRNPRRAVCCEDCAGGQFAGQPIDAARERGMLSEPAATGGS